jgi:N-acetylneuraminic acid mutarotase
MLLVIPFPGQIASAGTVWKEGPEEFADGQRENLNLGPEGLNLSMPNEPVLYNWMNVSPPKSPSDRFGSAMDYDSRLGKGVMFGGAHDNWYTNDTWTYDLDTNIWTRKDPADAPEIRESHTMAYDSATGEFVMFGGFGRRKLTDTWTYNLSTNTWKNPNPATGPGERANSCIIYDSTHDKMILFGGFNAREVFGDTWTYNPSTNEWKNMTPSIAPSARWGHAMVYDRAHGVVVLFGGKNGDVYLNDTWTYNLSTNTWTEMNPLILPPARAQSTMVYNCAQEVGILFGGGCKNDQCDTCDLCDTWTYNLSTNSWTNITPSTSPPARGECAMFYDSPNNAVVVFGGFGDQNNWSDTWTLSFNSGTSSAHGSYISAPHDTGGSAYFGTTSWEADVPANATLRFQFRSADTEQNLTKKNFLGPAGTSASYYQISGQRLNPMNNGTRWFQYQAYFATDDINHNPLLRGVTVNYNLLHSIDLLSPSGGDNWTGLHNITWSSADKDNDTLAFDLYLENETAKFPLANDLRNETRKWSWNTDTIPNGTYWIRLTARDDNSSIPLSIDATSGKFRIQHPAPPPVNHLPHITLISPSDNSFRATNTAHLLWLGADPDNDPLTYTVNYSDRPFSQGAIKSQATTSEFLDLSNLFDNTTYYWTVDASDGRSNGTDIPTEIWSFTIRLPPANIPVRFTSTPSTIAWVGREYTYNLTSIDEDGDIPSYTLISTHSNVTLDSSTGKLRWTPSTSDIGNHTITVQVADSRGSTDNQTFTITVIDIPPIIPPKCAITYPANGTTVKGTMQVLGTASNGSLALSAIKIRMDNGAWTAVVGLENWTFTINTAKLARGNHRIEAKAFAANLSSETASIDLTVSNPEPSVSTGGNQWCLPAGIVAVMAGIAVLILLRKKIATTNR